MVDYDGRHAGIAHVNVPVSPSGYIYIKVRYGKLVLNENREQARRMNGAVNRLWQDQYSAHLDSTFHPRLCIFQIEV